MRLTSWMVVSCRTSDFLYLWALRVLLSRSMRLVFRSGYRAASGAGSQLIRMFMEAMCDLLTGNMVLDFDLPSGR